MPLEFANTSHWTLSIGKSLPNDIEVTLTNRKTGKIQKFSNKNTKTFYISNSNFGLPGCVIFEGPLEKDEVSYRVDVNGKNVAISYDVNFFNVKCNHKLDLLATIEPSCIKTGTNFYCCQKCGDYKKEEEIQMKPHKEKFLDKINPTCTEEGIEYYKCEFCFNIIEKKIDKIPHNYEYKLYPESNGQSSGVCTYCEKSIRFRAPTSYKVWWGIYRNSYSNHFPRKMKINSTLYCWISDINGDYEYNEIVLELSNNNLVEIEDRNDNKDLKLIGVGKTEIIIYPKYNPNLKKTFTLYIE